MTDNEKRAHDIALLASVSKIIALLNECNHTGKQLSYSFYDMYQACYKEVLPMVKSDYGK